MIDERAGSEADDSEDAASLAALIRNAERARASADAARDAARVELGLRFWHQHVHLTVPASDVVRARKAVESGTEPVARQMARLGLPAAALADRLRLPTDVVAEALDRPRRAPLVVLDGEDAELAGMDAGAGGQAAARLLRDAGWAASTLRFYRPPGLNQPDAARGLVSVLHAAGLGREPAAYPLDGVVFPKAEQPEEIDWLVGTLVAVEAALGLAPGRIRVALLIESGWAVAQLPALARRAGTRLCALILGTADLSADLGLPRIADRHFLADWARAQVVTVAGALGVPAIDGMTLAYPVADAALDAAANRDRFLERMALVYDDARHARDMGMAGKWVGHPAQLLAVELAFRQAQQEIDAEIHKLVAYEAAQGDGRGAAIIGGAMADRATDRHARMLLRRATAMGWLEPHRALRFGVIEQHELPEAMAIWRG